MSGLTNGIGWFEVGTADTGTAERFYGGLFGWRFGEDPGTGYREITTPAGDSVGGGLFRTPPGVPSYAIFYVEVADVAATSVAAEAAGGKVLVSAHTDPDGLTFAHLLDPAGNHFGVYTPPSR